MYYVYAHNYCSFSDEVVPHLASLEETELHLSELADTLPPPKSGSVTWMHTPIADLQVKTKVTVPLYGHTFIHYFAFAIKQWSAMEYPHTKVSLQSSYACWLAKMVPSCILVAPAQGRTQDICRGGGVL